MKKIITLLVFTSFISTFFASANAEFDARSDRIFVFPYELKEIEEEAFEGTAVKTIILREHVVCIEKKAFSDTSFLTDVYIPATTKHIGEHAFSENNTLIIHGVRGSFTEKWAIDREIPFANDYATIFFDNDLKKTRSNNLPRDKHNQPSYLLPTEIISKKTDYRERSMRPQDRTELYPIDYRFP